MSVKEAMLALQFVLKSKRSKYHGMKYVFITTAILLMLGGVIIGGSVGGYIFYRHGNKRGYNTGYKLGVDTGKTYYVNKGVVHNGDCRYYREGSPARDCRYCNGRKKK